MNIRHNLSGMTAKRYQSENVKKQGKTLEKLASGYRVNCAVDDAMMEVASTLDRIKHAYHGILKRNVYGRGSYTNRDGV